MSRKIATLSDMKQDGSDHDSGNEDVEDKKNNRQAFYVGGSEKSGQQVLGPAKSKADEIVNNIFRQAREHGAEVVDKSQSRPSTAGHSGAFAGGGVRLGDSTSASASVSADPLADFSDEPRSVHVRLQMWRNGFVVDDGPLRPYEDPENRLFLESIMQKRIPPELLMKHRGMLIELDLVNRKGDNYKQPTVVAQPFQGQGNVLGSPSPDVVGAGHVGTKADSESKLTSNVASAFESSVAVDPSKPVSNIQIRLADGTRLTARFNATHRIVDIRNYIIEAHPSLANSPFVLMTSFPKQELTDENKTLQDAGLINVVILQHLKPNQ